jgi:hypothetical protein
MMKVSGKRLGVTLVSLAVPFMMAAPAALADAPSPAEVANVAGYCLGYGYDVSTCSGAVKEGVEDVVEEGVNADLYNQGVSYTVDIGAPAASEPGNLAADVNAISVNPLPPLPPVIAVPPVPFQ